MTLQDRDEIEGMIRRYPWRTDPGPPGTLRVFNAETAARRARILTEDMCALRCKWEVRSHPAVLWGHALQLPYYLVPGTEFGRPESDGTCDTLKAHGFGLNWGSVIRLSKACEIGRQFFASRWPTHFRKKFRNDHLSFIEELLWLGQWRNVTNLQYEAQPFLSLGCEKKVDWRFKSCGQQINLEVKYRPRDWTRHVDGPEFNVAMPSYFGDIPPKFPGKSRDELNIVAVSTSAGIDRSIRERTETLIRSSNVDAVVIWAQASRVGTNPFEVHALKDKPLVDLLLTGGDFEDKMHIGIVLHLWRKRDERRDAHADEVPDLLAEAAEYNRRARL